MRVRRTTLHKGVVFKIHRIVMGADSKTERGCKMPLGDLIQRSIDALLTCAIPLTYNS